MNAPFLDRDGWSVALSAFFGLILLSAIYSLISGDTGMRQVTRALIFGSTIVLGVGEVFKNRSRSRTIIGATLLVACGFVGLYVEVTGDNGFRRPVVIGGLLLGIVLARSTAFIED